jgi:hypothetical protein
MAAIITPQCGIIIPGGKNFKGPAVETLRSFAEYGAGVAVPGGCSQGKTDACEYALPVRHGEKSNEAAGRIAVIGL